MTISVELSFGLHIRISGLTCDVWSSLDIDGVILENSNATIKHWYREDLGMDEL